MPTDATLPPPLAGDTPETTPRDGSPPSQPSSSEKHVDISDAPGDSAKQGGGKFGKLGGGKGVQTAETRAKLASWSESGGVREAAFKKPRSVPID